ncbi:MaoC family dehydratase [Microbispora sp. H10836]|uniref:MaoC family dehydratase n=1 Tax=Microbispora sp. H10836 TaxID=2729106 RepID=UPI001475F9B0|nr:MaoC family dehydratase [Microbispora sp. H10836]
MSTLSTATDPYRVDGVADALALPLGQVLGHSSWVEITQEQVNQFAQATGDHQWIHVDVEGAKDGPFGGTVAHGYLTLSLIPSLLPEALELRGFSMGVNYGCDRVRFPAPVPVGSRLRASVVADAVTEVAGGVQLTLTLTFELEGGGKPACVATIVIRQYP